MKNIIKLMQIASTAWNQMGNLQEILPTYELIPLSSQYASNWPIIKKLKEHAMSMPLYLGGDVSDCHTGTLLETNPNPIPATTRPTINSAVV